MHVEVKELAPALRAALESVGYGARDVEVIPATEAPVLVAGGSGQRGFLTAVDLSTGERKHVNGSWGGANMFATGHAAAVDMSDERVPIPPHGAVVKGTTGYPRTFACVYLHPDACPPLLGAGDEDPLTDEEQQAIYCFAAIKGGEYRRDEMRRRNVTPATVDGLVQRGYLKRNRAGATAITTKGKNARTIRN